MAIISPSFILNKQQNLLSNNLYVFYFSCQIILLFYTHGILYQSNVDVVRTINKKKRVK